MTKFLHEANYRALFLVTLAILISVLIATSIFGISESVQVAALASFLAGTLTYGLTRSIHKSSTGKNSSALNEAEKQNIARVDEHFQLVGHACVSWSGLEKNLEFLIWWLQDINPDQQREKTASLDFRGRTKLIKSIAERSTTLTATQRCFIEDVISRVVKDSTERNLAVHGLRLVKSEFDQFYVVTSRGKYKEKIQSMPPERIARLIIRIDGLSERIKQFLLERNVLHPGGSSSSLEETRR